ncbi:MAG TPA: undecaprenyl-diphosphate phosphatase [Gemmatimonadales bacterium]|nr:undecaprenyl-diphosphate phosphatase [Gemmatimonadales bacterium]
MSILDALILGLVQGVTEFLPISSDGHLALAQHLLGQVQPLFFDVAVHVATLAAIVIAFREAIWKLLRGVIAADRDSRGELGLYAAASVPTVVAGLVLEPRIEAIKESLWFVGAAFVVMGVVLWSARRRMDGARRTPTLLEAVAIGVGQAAAILPAISRSGSTITIALWRGIEPIRAAEFSFVLGVPAIAGAALLEARHLTQGLDRVGILPLGVAMASAFLSGLGAIALLRRMLRARAFHRFAPYLWLVGAATLVLAGLRR